LLRDSVGILPREIYSVRMRQRIQTSSVLLHAIGINLIEEIVDHISNSSSILSHKFEKTRFIFFGFFSS